MSEEERLTPAERELEAALGGLRVTEAEISRDGLMFQAGLRAARRRNRIWQGFALLLVVLLGAAMISRPGPPEAERIAARPAPAKVEPVAMPMPAPGPGEIPETAYLKLRQDVLEHGLDALPAMPASSPAPAETDRMLQPLQAPRRAVDFKLDLGPLKKLIFPGDSL